MKTSKIRNYRLENVGSETSVYRATGQDVPQEMEGKYGTADLIACSGSAWVLLS